MENINRKQILIIALGCLFFGAIIGWSLSPSGNDHEGHAHSGDAVSEYTCSMHPQIRQEGPGQCPLCGMDLTPVASRNGGASDPMVFEMTPEAVALANVAVVRVTEGGTAQQVRLSGKIQPDEQQVNSIAADFSGRIDKLYVSFTGQEVKRGERLASVYSPDLINAQKELLEASRMKERQPMLYEAAREKLRLWRVSDKQIEEIEAQGEVNSTFEIYANASGYVTARNIAVGDFISRGTVLFEIVDLSRVWVMLDAYESDLGWLSKGNQLTFTVNAIPGKEFKGTVNYIDPIINPETRTVSVRAEVSNPGQQLKPEMFVNATVHGGQQAQGESTLMIPRSSVLWTGKRSVVYVQRGTADAPAFEMVEVQLGSRVGDQYQVLSGVSSGDKIVSNGVFAIDAAAQLSGNYSMMGRPEAKTLEVPDAFRKQIGALVNSYLELKDALVETEPDAAAKSSLRVTQALGAVDMKLLDEKAHNIYMPLHKSMQTSSQSIAERNDVELQREAFEILSEHLIETVEYFGIEQDKLYKQFCPMAFDDQGAFWLSAESEIKNPYYGDMMLSCGEVKKTYEKGKLNYADKKAASAEAQHHH
ncbi:efflux RND transporter periplasmic adaptor subunit [Litoribacter ruber]|uniref:efflux RND transporter periplasmic adaptor subunit n=1 Tax=Litoribacter ruber TaxID=702568 RepID=UPI001BDA8D2D|nr:efflux RND transporter periplasmic adaptor subunit [Litoribacter ruber]MBT0810767.1 efflux RND transporter periplasmic adaptor subunit [Litoribacter ruber]